MRGVRQLRDECRIGFECAGPGFRCDVPDLKIIVRGDIAVTWGLNRKADYDEGSLKSAMWSRGTRIFRRIDGRWKMIHQHVSFPLDPAKGAACFDLKPDAD